VAYQFTPVHVPCYGWEISTLPLLLVRDRARGSVVSALVRGTADMCNPYSASVARH
jgi:hypothetical protein